MNSEQQAWDAKLAVLRKCHENPTTRMGREAQQNDPTYRRVADAIDAVQFELDTVSGARETAATLNAAAAAELGPAGSIVTGVFGEIEDGLLKSSLGEVMASIAKCVAPCPPCGDRPPTEATPVARQNSAPGPERDYTPGPEQTYTPGPAQSSARIPAPKPAPTPGQTCGPLKHARLIGVPGCTRGWSTSSIQGSGTLTVTTSGKDTVEILAGHAMKLEEHSGGCGGVQSHSGQSQPGDEAVISCTFHGLDLTQAGFYKTYKDDDPESGVCTLTLTR